MSNLHIAYEDQVEWCEILRNLEPTNRRCVKCKTIPLELDESLCAACLTDMYVVTDTRTAW